MATANDATGDLRAVQDLARHREISTTAGYTRTTTRRLVAAMLAIDYDEPDPEEGQAESPEAEIARLRAEVVQLQAIIEHLTSEVPPGVPARRVPTPAWR